MADGLLIDRIHKLPDSLINKIAAGEVIERPASVIKELLENSLDAGATRINIDIRNGGNRLIRVGDNGHGIHPDDLMLAMDRHTTSKLHDDGDLWQIKTLGFRGEALSSIASVSRFTLTSKQNAAEYGCTVTFAKGNASPVIQPAAHPVGTTVEVKDLFYNTPVRRKFLRSERTEFIHIQDLVKRIAMSRFNLSIRLTHNDRQVFHVTADEHHPVQRVVSVMGRPFQTHALMVDQQSSDMKLYGWLGQPDSARSQTDLQYFYLNGRMVKDKLVNHAIRLAFQDKLYAGRYPVYLLYLDMDAATVDINVHPAKQEVRFRDARTVHDFIFGTLQRVLNELIESINGNSHKAENQLQETRTDYKFKNIDPAIPYKARPDTGSSITICGRYIIAEESDGAILVDVQHARKWIAYIKLKKEWSEGYIRSRPVLVPLACQVSVSGAELIEQYQELLVKLGLNIQCATSTELLIRELPLVLSGADVIAVVMDVLSILKHYDEDRDKQNDNLLKMLSRHANDSTAILLTTREINLLLAELQHIKSQLTFDEYKTILRQLDMQSLHKLLNG